MPNPLPPKPQLVVPHPEIYEKVKDLGTYNAKAKRIIILLTDAPPYAKDCFRSSTISTNATCYLGPQYLLSGANNILSKLQSKNISMYYLNVISGVCTYNKADVNLSTLTGGEFYAYNSTTASVEVAKILMNISYQMNITNITNITTYENVTETYYAPVQEWNSLRIVVYNGTSSYIYNMPKDTPIILPLETRNYEIETGSLTNINRIEVYIVVETSNGNEDAVLVAMWKGD